MSAIHSEDQILTLINEAFPGHGTASDLPGLILGRGDDCAELEPPSPMAISTDIFLENYHFSRLYFSPEQIGAKALTVNLSDLASSGSKPQAFSLGLMCPRDVDSEFLRGLFAGMAQAARDGGVALSGGDISAAPSLGFSITVWGGPAAGLEILDDLKQPFLRRGAKKDDVIFAVGRAGLEGAGLGLARLGLERLEENDASAVSAFPQACNALLSPVPMLEAGQVLASLNLGLCRLYSKNNCISAMDLSDGLLRDLPRLLDSPALGADITLNWTDLHPEIRHFFRLEDGAGQGGQAEKAALALALALSGGDEYCLLCAAPSEQLTEIREALNALSPAPSFQIIGKVCAEPGLRWQGKELGSVFKAGGFDHFQKS